MSKKQNAEEDYITTPISVLSYITALESKLEEARYSATDYALKLGRANEKLAEAREAIKEHKKRKKSWGFEGSDYDKVLWEQLKEQNQ